MQFKKINKKEIAVFFCLCEVILRNVGNGQILSTKPLIIRQ